MEKENKKSKYAIVVGNGCFRIKENIPDVQIKTYRKFHSQDILFDHEQETNLYHFYYFRVIPSNK